MVFTEYFPQQHEQQFGQVLADAGWKHQVRCPVPAVKANRTFIASRWPLERDGLALPDFDRQFPEARAVGMTLFDQQTDVIVFAVSFWHWRAIVEAVRSFGVLSGSRVDALHEQFVGELAVAEARVVAAAIHERLLSTLQHDERLLLDGRRTIEPDDGTYYRDPAEQHQNYSTDRQVLREFAQCCAACGGFRVS